MENFVYIYIRSFCKESQIYLSACIYTYISNIIQTNGNQTILFMFSNLPKPVSAYTAWTNIYILPSAIGNVSIHFLPMPIYNLFKVYAAKQCFLFFFYLEGGSIMQIERWKNCNNLYCECYADSKEVVYLYKLE